MPILAASYAFHSNCLKAIAYMFSRSDLVLNTTKDISGNTRWGYYSVSFNLD